MAYSTILWDLDGTLTDPAPGITRCVQFALRGFGIEVQDKRILYPFIGPPLADSFMLRYGMSKADADRAVALFRQEYDQGGLFENTPYPGIAALLERLRGQGYGLAVASSKPTETALRVLEHFDLARYFDRICGSGRDGTRYRKVDVIEWALESMGVKDKKLAVMVGDTEYDIQGAREAGIDAIGVLYGYGSETSMRDAGAVHLALNLQELEGFLREKRANA